MGLRVSDLIAGALALSLAGCLSTHTGRPVHGAQPNLLGQHPVPGLNAPIPDHWQRVFVGQLPRPQLAGYVRSHQEQQDEGAPLLIHWVYDYDMKLVGVVSARGQTTRFDRFGKAHYLGGLTMDKSVLAIYDYDDPENNPVRFLPMPEPKD